MPKKRDNLISKGDLEIVMKDMINEIVLELKKIVASKEDVGEFTEKVILRLESIDRHFLELKGEIQNLRIMYEFWAERHLSPDFMEQFLKEQEKQRKPMSKIMD